MPVPPDDILCRFIDPKYWSEDDQRPALSAFRATRQKGFRTYKLSMWHQDRIISKGDHLVNLCIDSLVGFGEALITTREILSAADEIVSSVFRPRAEWKPEEVTPPWMKWRDAHIDIESETPSKGFPDDFRKLLVERCFISRPPDVDLG